MEASKITFYKKLPEEQAILGTYCTGGTNIFVGIFKFAPYCGNYVLVDDAVANSLGLAEKKCLERYYRNKKSDPK